MNNKNDKKDKYNNYIICLTRFNEFTLNENKRWRENNKHNGCIYGTPVKISDNIIPNSNVLVIEMNNSKNIIEGIGFIKNKLHYNKKLYKIYQDNNYNRFIYKSNIRIDKNDFQYLNNSLLTNIEDIEEKLFKSKKHSKRGQGIQNVSSNFNYDDKQIIISLYYYYKQIILL